MALLIRFEETDYVSLFFCMNCYDFRILKQNKGEERLFHGIQKKPKIQTFPKMETLEEVLKKARESGDFIEETERSKSGQAMQIYYFHQWLICKKLDRECYGQ